MSASALPRVALLLALVCMTAPAWAAPPALTLEEALAYAGAHQPFIRRALAEVDARLADAKVPRAAWLPQIGATAQLLVGTTNNTTASYLNVPEVDLPRIGATPSVASGSWSPSPSTLAAITVDQQIYDFGRIAAQSAVVDALADRAKADATAAWLEVQLTVKETFAGVLAARAVLGATEDAQRRAATHRDYAQAGTKSGLRPPIELTRAQADVALLEVRWVRADAGLRAAQAALAAAIGSDAVQVDARESTPVEVVPPAHDDGVRFAVTHNPLIVAALAGEREQRARTRVAIRDMVPNLFLSSTLSGRAGGATPTTTGADPTGGGWLPDVANWHVGLVLQWNLFDATVLARRAASRAREEVARADVELARNSVGLAVERTYLELDAAQRALPGLAQAVDAARANQAQAEARFKAGMGTTVELADAEALLTNAELELAIGRFTLTRTRARLDRVLADTPTPK